MKKFLLSSFVIGSFALYVVYYGPNGSLSYVAPYVPVTEVGKKTTTDALNTTSSSTQVYQVPNSISGGDEDSNPFDEEGDFIPPTKTTPKTNTKPTTTPTTKPTTQTTPTTTPPVTKPKGLYADGTYVGSNEYAYSGYVKVTAIISNGKLSNITYPSTEPGPRRSQQIYDYSMPVLKQEAISAQSANINGVSGATYTSDAFMQSLAYALTQAKQ